MASDSEPRKFFKPLPIRSPQKSYLEIFLHCNFSTYTVVTFANSNEASIKKSSTDSLAKK